jgi:uncharacterized phage infection (PIP) family protein YhgE
MAQILSPLHKQIARVSRRLFFQTMLACLLWCWAGSLAVIAGWFLLQPHLWPALSPEWRLGAAGAVLGLGTLLGLGLAVFRAPSRVAAALLLDERFALKERVTTSLTLSPHQLTTSAATALLEDVNQRIEKLDVGSRFPLRVSWQTVLGPVIAGGLALAAFTYHPTSTQAKGEPNADELAKTPPANQAEIEQKMHDLLKKKIEKPQVSKEMSEELKQIEMKLEEIANKPRNTQEQLRERIKEMTALEDLLKDREKELADKNRSLKEKLQQLDNLAAKEASKDGPAKDLQKALAQGKLNQAKEEIEKLAEKLKKNELTAKEKEQLAKQLKDIEDNLKKLAQQKDKEEQLKKMIQEAKANNRDAEALEREMDQVQKEKKNLQSMEDLANAIGQCRKAVQGSDGKEAADRLKGAADNLKDMDLADKDLEDLRDSLQRLQDAKDSC